MSFENNIQVDPALFSDLAFSESEKFKIYAQKWGSEHGLSETESISFGRVCAFMFTNAECELIDNYYTEDAIVSAVVDEREKMLWGNPALSDEDINEKLFLFIFKIYKEELEEYSYKRMLVQSWLSKGMKEYLDKEVPGRSGAEKIRFLVEYYKESQEKEE